MENATITEQGVIAAPTNDLFGMTVVGASMLQAAHAAYPERNLDYGIGYAKIEGPVDTFRWQGIDWTADIVVGRLVWVGVAVGMAIAAALLFDRFDPARRRLIRRRSRPRRWRQWLAARREQLAGLWPRVRWPLPPFGRVWVAELRMLVRGQPWWWYAVALIFVIGSFTAEDPQTRRTLWLLAWLWPVLAWSKLGMLERRHRTEPVVFSAPQPLTRQLPAMWLAGVAITVLMGSGAGLRFLLDGATDHVLAWGVAVLFIPAFALAAGIWSGSSKLFEAVYVVMWYMGAMQGLAELDFAGANPGTLAAGMPSVYLGITAALLVAAGMGRLRQMRS
jgi:hypothetical protein